MAAFLQNFSITQSEDCTTLSFADISNMVENDSSYDYSTFTTKTYTVYDSTNTIIGSPIPFVDATPVTFTLDKDRFLTIIQTLQINSDSPLTKQYDVALSCNVDLKFGDFLMYNILDENGITQSNNDDILFDIVKTIKAAKVFASRANGTLSQDMLDLANSYTDYTKKSFN